MSTLGFTPDDLRRMAEQVRGGVEDDDVAAEVVARSAWSILGEPGDGMAGLLVLALGAAPALSAVLAGTSPTVLARDIDPEATVGREVLERGLADALARWRPRLRSATLVQSIAAAQRTGTRLLVPGDDAWPTGVDDLGVHGPAALWYRGSESALAALGRSVALVGARECTKYGAAVATDSAAGLAERGFAIVSGAAYGIDAVAHRATLSGDGMTVAFLAGGADRFYPAGNDALLARIVERGAVVSELPCGAQPTKWRFLQRNRLIAASSRATVVVEAGWRSGTLNTAGHAASLGRPLGAVPGPVTSVASAGCHRLLREYDARCVTTADEMAELVTGTPGGAPAPALVADRSSHEVRVIDALSTRSARTADDIARRAGLSTASVVAVLGTLSLDGSARQGDRGWLRS
ncbi:DNA-processing protein DprA [Rathayibacter sp. YIM 133350]|uniref:DNA-processing protein DprA n=1 Tax=Rathayibacter sp. YIM 133350 TaxID=3131992 RepID=UPI00307E9D63